jgi:hypothetical protein
MMLSTWYRLLCDVSFIGCCSNNEQVGFAIMTATTPTDAVPSADLLHIDPKLFHPKMRSTMSHVTVALTQSVLAIWDTQACRLWLLWDVADIIVEQPNVDDETDDLTLVITKTNSEVKVCLVPLTHQVHPSSNWKSEGSQSSAAQWRARIRSLLRFHGFVRTFQPPVWPFRATPSEIDSAPISCGASVLVAVAPNIVWLLAEPATIVVVHLLLQKEIGRVKVPVERPHCTAVGDGIVVCWALPGGGSLFETSNQPLLQIFRACDCCVIMQKHMPIPAVRSCCVSSGFIWVVTTNGLVCVISQTGALLEEFDFNLYEKAGALSVCACASFSPDVLQTNVVVSSHSGAFLLLDITNACMHNAGVFSCQFDASMFIYAAE